MDSLQSKIGQRILKGTGILMLGRIAAMVLGLLQTILIARFFGATSVSDAFFVAAAIPVLFLGVVENNLGLTFTPLFVELEQKGDSEGAWTLAATLFKGGSVVVGSYMVLTMVFAVPLAWALAPGFDSATRTELIRLIVCLSPMALLLFIGATFTTLCFIRGVFLLPALTHIVTAFCPCLSMILLHQHIGIYAMPIGMLAGASLSGFMLFMKFGTQHMLFRTPAKIKHPAVKQLAKHMVLRSLTTSFMQINATVDRIFASRIAPGHVAHLAYAQQIIMSIRRLFIVPLGRSLMPPMSRAAADNDFAQVRTLVRKVINALGFATVPIFALLIGFRHEVIELILARGEFSDEAVRFTALALLFYSIGGFFSVLNPILTGTLFAFRDSLSPLKTVAISVVINVLLNYLCIRLFSFGGIALATSAVAAVGSVMLWKQLVRHTAGLELRQMAGVLMRTLVAALVMLGAAKAASSWLHARWEPVLALELILCMGIGGVVYLVIQAIINPTAFKKTVQIVRRK